MLAKPNGKRKKKCIFFIKKSKIMKKLLYTILALSIIFSACKKEEQVTTNTNNNGNNSANTISDVVGIWEFKGDYDALGNLLPFESTVQEDCALQSTITLQSDGNAIWTGYYLQNEISGPCLSESQVFTFNYINSTTLEFIIPSSCGNATVTLPSSTQFKIPSCNADTETYDGGYLLYEL